MPLPPDNELIESLRAHDFVGTRLGVRLPKGRATEAAARLEDLKAQIRQYENIASMEDMLKAMRQAGILLDFINDQPKPVKDAWISYLRDQKAL